MKKYAMLVLASVFMLSTVLVAQSQIYQRGKKGEQKEFKRGEMSEMSAQKRAEFLTQKLELTDAEKLKVQALMEKQELKREQHRAEMKKLREERQAKFEAERKAHEVELIEIIGNEKFQKLQSMRIGHLEKMNRRNKMHNHKCVQAENEEFEKPMRMKKEIVNKGVK